MTDLQPDPPGEVLAEVDDMGAGQDAFDRVRPQLGHRPDGLVGGCHQQAVIGPRDQRPGPAGVVETGQLPAVGGAPQIVAFALQQIGVADRARAGAPGPVGGDEGGPAVRPGQVEFGQELGDEP